jgi:hypothetical protein
MAHTRGNLYCRANGALSSESMAAGCGVPGGEPEATCFARVRSRPTVVWREGFAAAKRNAAAALGAVLEMGRVQVGRGRKRNFGDCRKNLEICPLRSAFLYPRRSSPATHQGSGNDHSCFEDGTSSRVSHIPLLHRRGGLVPLLSSPRDNVRGQANATANVLSREHTKQESLALLH